ncbi:MAG: glutamine amidotransferase [Planctomycetota bacterium]|nr:glutamine amidotransferase [Planctomycetota bacterium]
MTNNLFARTHLLSIALLHALLAALPIAIAETPWVEIPRARWEGTLEAEVPALKRTSAAVVALPAKEAQPLAVTSPTPQPAGLYEVRLTLRPSHVANAIAFHTGVRVMDGDQVVAAFPGEFFARVHQPETRTFQLLHATGPLSVQLGAFADSEVIEKVRVKDNLAKGGPKADISLTDDAGDGELDLDFNVDQKLTPDRAVYYLVDAVAFRPLSVSGRVAMVEIDKIRYLPGATLKGRAVVLDVGGQGGSGTLNLYLEHNVNDRVKAQSLPVTLGPEPKSVSFEVTLPQEELGYALVTEFVSDDGKSRHEAAEYFNIAENFQRVAIFGGGLATRDAVLDDETIRRGLAAARKEYFNASEYFAWAEDDLVEMSPDADFWSSGQTNYRMHKQTIQRQIQLAHEQGFAVSTYGKFLMSGLPGWETAYDYPNDHRGKYNYPVGMWSGVHVGDLDLRRDQVFVSYPRLPNVPGNAFRTWWASFLPISAGDGPGMVRMAADECVRSVEMFGWDAIRWDGHPRAGWHQTGRSGTYSPWAARQIQSLVRYFKDIVAEKHPDFRHGYNYLLVERKKGYDWAVEDYELDELCRGGGLLMNESIGNASAGYTFEQIARNLQVDGDLCRERGGYYLGISYAMSRRDIIIESALWAAGGCRPYNTAMDFETRRFCTRYSQYTFDERLRRLSTPEKVLAPQAETKLWWQPFVYETPLDQLPPSSSGGLSPREGAGGEGRRQLVINLLNIPQQDPRPNNRDGQPEPVWNMPAGTDPVTFALTLPDGLRATAVNLIEPRSLAVTPLALKHGRFTVPAVATWKVVVIDLAAEGGAPSLAALYGPKKTFGVPRPGVEESQRRPEVVLDPRAEIREVREQFRRLAPDWQLKAEKERAAFEALSGKARDEALLAKRPGIETLAKEWWKGAAVPADLKLKDNPPVFGDLSPERNGRFDIFYGRGAMDYRLKMHSAFARLGRFRFHDAWLWGAVHAGPGGAGLANNVPPSQFPEFDLFVLTSIPHAAIGVERSYAMADYVKAGGAVFFTGGEYAFGKGGYIHTVLERELLPFQCVRWVDTIYPQTPQPFEPGPDFADLGVDLDFAARPVFWVRNEVVLKPGAKVFLKSGDRPILVGWQVGKGRVACLLVDHRGKSEDGHTAFFDWQDWPALAGAVMRWLAPEAGATSPGRSKQPEAEAALAKLKQLGEKDELAGFDAIEAGDDAGLDLPGVASVNMGAELKPEELKERLVLIGAALQGTGPELAAALAAQVSTVSNLPLRTRMQILLRLHRERPPGTVALGRNALKSQSAALHGCGYAMLALAGDESFPKILASPPPVSVESEDGRRERLHDLALAVAFYPKPDLVAEGKRRVEALNNKEAAQVAAYAKVCGDDKVLAETAPCLDADGIFERLARLAYLSRHDRGTYGAAFLGEWVKVGLYRKYCGITANYLIGQNKFEGDRAQAIRTQWVNLGERFRALQDLTRPEAEAFLAASPSEAGAVFAQARTTQERQVTINLLGDLSRDASAKILKALIDADHPDLAAFARSRQK